VSTTPRGRDHFLRGKTDASAERNGRRIFQSKFQMLLHSSSDHICSSSPAFCAREPLRDARKTALIAPADTPVMI